MDIELRNSLDATYRNLVNKREAIMNILHSLDEEILNIEYVLYDLHDDTWSPSDLF